MRHISRTEAKRLVESGEAHIVRSRLGKDVIQLIGLERENRPSPACISFREMLINAGLSGSQFRQSFIQAKVQAYQGCH